MKKKGKYGKIPGEEYPAIEQGAIILSSAPQKELARRFLAYLKTPPILELLKNYGFTVPTGASAR
jgi:ABC-type molybdate transport system substrate-binding protein